jgi:hypothetical protein
LLDAKLATGEVSPGIQELPGKSGSRAPDGSYFSFTYIFSIRFP